MAEPKVLYGKDGEKLVIFSPSEAQRLIEEEGYMISPQAAEMTDEEANEVLTPDGPIDSGATASGDDKPKRSRNTKSSGR